MDSAKHLVVQIHTVWTPLKFTTLVKTKELVLPVYLLIKLITRSLILHLLLKLELLCTVS